MWRTIQILLLLSIPALAQQAPVVMPPWLAPYPGTTPEIGASSSALIETAYTARAIPKDVVLHYEAALQSAKVPFQSNFDGTGTVIRAAAPECDLLIKAREDGSGTAVRTSCVAKSGSPIGGVDLGASQSGPSSGPHQIRTAQSADQFRQDMRRRMAEGQAAQERRTANRLAGRPNAPVWPPGPENDAPPLVWPSWLVHMKGTAAPKPGTDQSSKKYLESRYLSNEPMTAIFRFYEGLLNQNGYAVYRSKLGTGQTLSGIIQNANGYVEGAFHPYDMNGPRLVIEVSFSRTKLNDPIDVRLRITAYPRF